MTMLDSDVDTFLITQIEENVEKQCESASHFTLLWCHGDNGTLWYVLMHACGERPSRVEVRCDKFVKSIHSDPRSTCARCHRTMTAGEFLTPLEIVSKN